MAKKIKILLASRALESPPREGGFVILKDIANTLDSARFIPYMLSMKNKTIGQIRPDRVFSAVGWDKIVKIQYLIAIMIRSSRYDVVHTAHIPTLFNSRIMRRITAYSHVRGTRFVQTVTGIPKVDEKQLSKLLWGDYLVFQSPSAMARAKQVTSKPMELIVPWPSDNRVRYDPKRRTRTRKSLGISVDTNLVVFPGEFKRMGIDISFTDCINSFLEKCPNSKIIIACRFDFQNIGGEIASKFPDKVVSIGSASNIIELMEAADLVIFPAKKMHSKFHPPLIITEALTLGASVIVSDVVDIDIGISSRLTRLNKPVSWTEFGVEMYDALQKKSYKSKFNNPFQDMVKSYETIYLGVQKSR